MKPEEDPKYISRKTVGHYDRAATEFWEATKDHDVRQNIEALLEHIIGKPPFTILDFGCGPGRDLKAFTDLGHKPIGLDGAHRFVEMARAKGFSVWHQDFLQLDLPNSYFDGVFANASLFHVPTAHLPRVLKELNTALKPKGVLFASNPRGDSQEGWNGDRYAAYHDLETWRSHMEAAGFTELAHYYRPVGLPRDQQPWLASVWRKMQNAVQPVARIV